MSKMWMARPTRKERRRAARAQRRRARLRVAAFVTIGVLCATLGGAVLVRVADNRSTAASADSETTAAPRTQRKAEATTVAGPADTAPAPVEAVFTLPAAQGYHYEIGPVSAAELGDSWHPGCPVGPNELRAVTVRHFDFAGTEHDGIVIVHAGVAATVAQIFERLYDARFPVRSIMPVAAFGGSDDASMDADNTSAFNCRLAVADGPGHWSNHAFGKAIDINPRENPYLYQDRAWPVGGEAYADRSAERAGMAVPGGVLVSAFADFGWAWGGTWTDPDYQHFSTNGH